MRNSPGKTGGTAVVKESQKETQEQKVRLQIVLLFYDHTDSEWGKTFEDGFVCIQESKQLRKVPFEIEGTESSNNEILRQYLLPIKEIIEIPKGKKSSEITKLQQIILDLVKFEICSNNNKIILDILCPTDNKTNGPKDIYLTFLFDKSFAKQLSRYIDIKKSTISLLYKQEDKKSGQGTEDKPTKLDSKIAALMSHYVYFYLDWLEYVHVHVHGVSRYSNNKNDDTHNVIIKEFDIFNERGMGFLFGKGMIAIGGKEKIKYRVINRLREIAKVVNYSKIKIDIEEIQGVFVEIIENRKKIVNGVRSECAQTSQLETKIPNKEDRSEIIKGGIKKYLDWGLNQEYGYKGSIKVKKAIKDLTNAVITIPGLPIVVYKEICKIIDAKNKYKEYSEITHKGINKIFEDVTKSLDEEPKKILTNNKGLVEKLIYASFINNEESIYDKKYDEKTATNQFIKTLDDICASLIYIDILSDCKKNERPVGFYDLYDKFGYWDYLKDQDLKEEAKHWYVSHPYIIYKNDYEEIKTKAKDTNISSNLIIPYKKLLRLLPRKTDEVFIPIEEELLNGNKNTLIQEKRWLVYNTVLTHGMDQLSGYGGLLFTKVDENGKAKKFAYCTKGTDVNSFNDWVLVDLLQGVTGFSLQHLHNVKNAITINKKVEEYDEKIPLFYCGHSLGGGLASACAIASKGRHAITFNAAGLNFLGVLATRTIGGFNYGWDVPNKVHPIRIDGEAIDALMVFSFFVLAHLNERAYGNAVLILKLKKRDSGWDLSESFAKHGINNFLYKPLMDALDIVDEWTVKCPVDAGNAPKPSIASLGSVEFEMDKGKTKKKTKKTNEIKEERIFTSGNYVLKFNSGKNGLISYKSILKCSYEDVMKLFSEVHIKKLHPSMKESAKEYLKKMYGFECPD